MSHFPTLGGDCGAPHTPHHPRREYPVRPDEGAADCAKCVAGQSRLSPRRMVAR